MFYNSRDLCKFISSGSVLTFKKVILVWHFALPHVFSNVFFFSFVFVALIYWIHCSLSSFALRLFLSLLISKFVFQTLFICIPHKWFLQRVEEGRASTLRFIRIELAKTTAFLKILNHYYPSWTISQLKRNESACPSVVYFASPPYTNQRFAIISSKFLFFYLVNKSDKKPPDLVGIPFSPLHDTLIVINEVFTVCFNFFGLFFFFPPK